MAATKQTAAQKKAAEGKAQAEAEAQAKADAEAQAKADAEAQAKADAEAQAKADAEAKAKATEELEYQVREPLLHNGDTYAPGDYIYLTAKQAERLSARSVIRLTGERA